MASGSGRDRRSGAAGDESACTRSCASPSCAAADHAALPEVLLFPAQFSRDKAFLLSLTIPPHAWVSGLSFPMSFDPQMGQQVHHWCPERMVGRDTLGKVSQIS